MTPPVDADAHAVADAEIARLRRRLERERTIRRSAESIAERATANLYQKHQEVQLMQRVSAAANAATELDSAFQTAIDLMCGHTGWPVGHIYLVVDGRLVPTSIWHLDDPVLYEHFRRTTEATAFRRGDGLPGRVLASATPHWIVDLAADVNFPRAAAAGTGLRSGFAFPILVGTEVVAVAEFFSGRLSEPDEGLLAVAHNVGTQLGRVHERKANEQKLVFDALHDDLTGLPNRALFLDRLGHALARSRRKPHAGFAVVYVDADRFKVVNDSLGHLAGDELLAALAGRLAGCIRLSDSLARLGGDEFALLLENVEGPRDVVIVAERIHQALASPFAIAGHEVFVTVSLGIVLSAAAYERPEDMLRDADTALYRAKAGGKARHQLFDPSMHRQALTLLRLENDLRRAVERDELCLFYQPIVDLAGGRLCGFEALLRWRHPDHGLVPPGAFIPLAEETGLIVPIGAWVVGAACAQLARWRGLGDGDVTVSVNIAARQFGEADLVRDVVACVAAAGLSHGLLKLELTESAVIQHAGAEAKLAEFHRQGFALLLDDFGTGYSSLSHLHRFPISTIKIDGSFVRRMTPDGDHREIVRAIILLAHTLGMDVIAEGVETVDQRDALVELGCSRAQGYLFSRPVEAAVAERFIIDGGPWRRVGSG